MAPISDETRVSLDRLTEQIRAAQQLLRRMPTTRLANCEVDVSDEMGILEPDQRVYTLRISDFVDPDDGRFEALSVVEYRDSDLDFVLSTTHLLEIPITKRIAVAECIPLLIEKAESIEDELPELANRAADAIQEALAQRQSE